jgi:DNA-binding CsgD family transcriptional regulator
MVEVSQLALNSTWFGVVVVNVSSRVLFLNHMAQELIAPSSGLAIVSGVLAATDPVVTARLMDRIRHAALCDAGRHRSAIGDAFRVTRTAGSPLMVLVVPLPRPEMSLAPFEPAAMLLITDPDRRRRPIGRHLIDWFGLSQAEATLAVQLAEGVRLDSLAQQRRVRISTLRSQLSAILSKTGTTRQPELVKLLHQLPLPYQPGGGA